MGKSLFYRFPLAKVLSGRITENNGNKPFPNIIHCLLRGMEHVGSIKAIIAQFVVDNLVGGEIHHVVHLFCQLVGSQKQRSLRQLTAVKAVLGVAYGAYGDDDTNRGINLPSIATASRR